MVDLHSLPLRALLMKYYNKLVTFTMQLVRFCSSVNVSQYSAVIVHRRSHRWARGWAPPKSLAYFAILCFARRYPTQNTVARLNSKDSAPKKLWAGYATVFSIKLKKLK